MPPGWTRMTDNLVMVWVMALFPITVAITTLVAVLIAGFEGPMLLIFVVMVGVGGLMTAISFGTGSVRNMTKRLEAHFRLPYNVAMERTENFLSVGGHQYRTKTYLREGTESPFGIDYLLELDGSRFGVHLRDRDGTQTRVLAVPVTDEEGSTTRTFVEGLDGVLRAAEDGSDG